VNQVRHDHWQHAQSAQHPDHRRLTAQLDQIDVEQRLPGRLSARFGHRRHGIGDVVDRQEVVGEREVGHSVQGTRGWPALLELGLPVPESDPCRAADAW
jgi:hypothetical protein